MFPNILPGYLNHMETLILIFLVLALVCFVLATIGFARLNFVALGLAFWVSTAILPHLK